MRSTFLATGAAFLASFAAAQPILPGGSFVATWNATSWPQTPVVTLELVRGTIPLDCRTFSGRLLRQSLVCNDGSFLVTIPTNEICAASGNLFVKVTDPWGGPTGFCDYAVVEGSRVISLTLPTRATCVVAASPTKETEAAASLPRQSCAVPTGVSSVLPAAAGFPLPSTASVSPSAVSPVPTAGSPSPTDATATAATSTDANVSATPATTTDPVPTSYTNESALSATNGNGLPAFVIPVATVMAAVTFGLATLLYASVGRRVPVKSVEEASGAPAPKGPSKHSAFGLFFLARDAAKSTAEGIPLKAAQPAKKTFRAGVAKDEDPATQQPLLQVSPDPVVVSAAPKPATGRKSLTSLLGLGAATAAGSGAAKPTSTSAKSSTPNFPKPGTTNHISLPKFTPKLPSMNWSKRSKPPTSTTTAALLPLTSGPAATASPASAPHEELDKKIAELDAELGAGGGGESK